MEIMDYPCRLCCTSEQANEQAVELIIDSLVNFGMPQC